MERGFGEFGPKLKEGINLRELMNSGFQEFTIQEEDLWDSKDEVTRMENAYEFEDIEKHVDLDCIKCDQSDVNAALTPFETLRKSMANVTEDGYVMKKVLRSGTTAIPEKAFVHLHYNAYLEMDEIPFDSTYLRAKEPVRLQIGVAEQLPGFEKAVLSMTSGEKAQFLVHPDYAYRAMGAPPRIPPNATILYVIEVMKVTDCGKALEEETLNLASRKNFSVVYGRAKAFRQLAGEYFRENNIIGAVDNYYKAEKLLVACSLNGQEEEDKWKRLMITIYTNIAVCFNSRKVNKPEKVCVAVRKAFEIDAKAASRSAKLYYQRGIAREAFGDYKEALSDLKKAQKLSPNDNVINERLGKLNQRIVEHAKMERVFSAKALGFEKLRIEEENVLDGIDPECREAVTGLLEEFAEEESSSLNLYSGYTASERAWLKSECERLGLKYTEELLENGSRSVEISKS